MNRCRECGCTEENGCVLDQGGNLVELADPFETLPDGYSVCCWVESDLCSGCVEGRPAPLLYDGDGKPLRGAP